MVEAGSKSRRVSFVCSFPGSFFPFGLGAGERQAPMSRPNRALRTPFCGHGGVVKLGVG